MSFAANLTRARSHLIIVFGLITASALIVSIEKTEPGRVAAPVVLEGSTPVAVRRDAAALAWAQIPIAQRTPQLQEAAQRLGVDTAAPPARPSPAQAAALLRSLDASGDARP